MCGTSQRFPPAHFNGGLSLDILLAFEVGAGGETRTLMSSEPRQILRALRRTTSSLFRRVLLLGDFCFHNTCQKRKMRPSYTSFIREAMCLHVKRTERL